MMGITRHAAILRLRGTSLSCIGTAFLMGACLSAQPAVFSHKTHAPLKQPCTQCHAGAVTGERARFPALATCVVCHTKMTEEQASFPTRRAFRMPDFVYFSHKVHADAKAACVKCHGDVTSMHPVSPAVEMNMKFCVDCHKTTEAAVDCFVCHELGQ